jgi:glycosyltransferase involved in cell wall biosynthesis
VLLLGGGPQDAELRALSTQLGLDQVVHFVGRVPHGDVARYCSAMDIMVFPRISRRLTELVTPLKPLESMAMGKLVAASDVGGHRELIRDGYNGHLFPAGSADALAQCLIERLQTRDAWSQVIANGRQFVERERTWTASVARYRAVYSNAIDRHRRSMGATHGR